MYTGLTVALVVSWLLLFVGLFIFEKLHTRLVRLNVQQEYMTKLLLTVMAHMGVEPQPDDLTKTLVDMIRSGQTYEAQVLYKSARGVSFKEAKVYIDKLFEGHMGDE